MLSWSLGWRFFTSKKTALLGRFMSFASTAGIAVGVFALITGLSAMNGFERELKDRVLSVIPAAQITSYHEAFKNPDGLMQKLLQASPDIVAAAPATELEVVFSNGRDFVPALLYGIDPVAQSKVTALERYTSVPLTALTPENAEGRPLPVILGAGIASRLKVQPGDTVRLMTVDKQAMDKGRTATLQSAGSLTLQVAGLMHIGGQLDSSMGFTDLHGLQQALNLPGPNQIQVRTSDLLQAQQMVMQAASASFDEACYVKSWMTTQGKLSRDIEMIRSIMYLAMILVMGVACFNIISTLMMSIGEKSREIAILLTMGARPSLIVRTFCITGLLSGALGTLIGAVTGSAFAAALTPVTANLEKWFGFSLLNEEIYFINFIPSDLQLKDVMLVSGCALAMSFIASLLPALKAARIRPALELAQ